MAAKKKTTTKKAAPKKKTTPVRKSAGAKGKKAAPKATSAKRPSGQKTSGKKSSSKATPRKRPTLKSKRPTLKSKAKRPARAKLAPFVHVPNPEALALARRIAAIAEEKKSLDVLIIDTQRRASSVGYDYIVVATGESDRQLTAVADGVREVLKPDGVNAIGVEASADWVMMDYGSVVTHLFTPDRRGHTDFEGMWADAPRVPVKG